MAGPYVSLQQILGAPNMLGIIKSTVSGIENPFPEAMFNVEKECHGNAGTYTVYSGARQLATVSNYGAPSKDRQLRELAVKPVTLLHSVENIQLKPTDYMNLLAYDDLRRQALGIDEVKRQVGELAEYQKNLRIAAMTMMLFWGQLYWDDKGNLLAPSAFGSGYGSGVNYQVPVTNTGQLQDVYGNAIIDTSWATASADIVQQITILKQTSVQLTGYKVRHAFYGAKIPQYLSTNTSIQAYLARAQFKAGAQGEHFLEEGEIQRLLGIQWHPAYDAYFVDSNGNVQKMVGDDQVVFCPEPSSAWVGMLEGTYPVPEYSNIITPVEPVMANGLPYKEQAGRFAYGVQTYDPAGLKVVYGDTFLPVLKVPAAIFQADVLPGSTS
jgi:hypothetical protein